MKNIVYILFILFFVGCIEEYTPKGIDEQNKLLIVDGLISDGKSIVRLSRSVGLNDKISNMILITNAQMHVECTDGTTYPFKISTSYGHYEADIDKLKQDQEYRLIIKVNGLEYQSDYMEPLKTPEIDTVYVQRDNSIDASVRVSTKGTEENSKYYRWTYDEIWEIRSRIEALATIIDGQPVMYDNIDGPKNEGLYCWLYNRFSNYQVATTEALSDNRIIGKELIETSVTDERFSQLYYIEVRQNSIRKATYDYIMNIEKNIEEIGSIFGPMPSEMKGNITCITNPDNPVIGYMDVSTTATKSIYLKSPNDVYEEGFMLCKLESQYDPPEGSYGVVSFLLPPPKVLYTIAPLKCMDCRHNGGTKVKPPFWPNDHE